MIYIKYTKKDNSSHWAIYAHEKGSKEETRVLNSLGETYPRRTTLNIPYYSQSNYIEYITEEQVDLLKLELL